MNLKTILSLAAAALLLAACSGTPGESDMADQIAEKINKQVGVKFVEIDDLEKTNGRMEGEERYIASVEYDLEFMKDRKEVMEALGKMQKGDYMGNAMKMVNMGILSAFGDFKAGDKQHTSNNLTFVQSENGWILLN